METLVRSSISTELLPANLDSTTMSPPNATESDAIVINAMSGTDKDEQVANQIKLSRIFFKTKLCMNFMHGTCHNGSNCNFAHGHGDIRFPPPNWRQLTAHDEDRGTSRNSNDNNDHQKKTQPCKMFFSGMECPYGSQCIFLHDEFHPRNVVRADDPTTMFRGNSFNSVRENAAINIPTAAKPPAGIVGIGNAVAQLDGNNVKFSHWKPRLCNKFMTTDHCPFDATCHFAHGQEELKAHISIPYAQPKSANIGPQPAPVRATQPQHGGASASTPPSDSFRVGPPINWIAQEKGLGKISPIYGDWPDIFPPN